MKKSNNKGFSLVELIVVVAIMAVLVGVLAPAYLKYVENSRIQKDESAVAEVVNAVKIALATEDVYDSVTFANDATATTVTITVSSGAISVDNVTAVTGATKTLLSEVQGSVGTKIDITSKLHKAHTSYVITLKSATDVSGAWS